jgi:hypothetical protein
LIESSIFTWADLDQNSPTHTSYTIGITDVHHPAQFISWDGIC